MQLTDFFGRVYDTEKLRPENCVYLVLPSCPIKIPEVLFKIMHLHVQKSGPNWRENSSVAHHIHAGAN